MPMAISICHRYLLKICNSTKTEFHTRISFTAKRVSFLSKMTLSIFPLQNHLSIVLKVFVEALIVQN